MADGTHIEWTDATWNIVTGCSVVSPGCTNCYAMKLAGTRLRDHPSRKGLTIASKAGPVWNGQVRFNAEWLDQPLRWTKPRRIFVAAHGDLFHDGVTDDQLDQIFAVMALTPQHTYQVLTKRPERMRAYLSDKYRWAMMVEHFSRMGAELSRDHFALVLPLPNVWLGVSVEDQTRADERIPVLLDTPAALRWISAEPLLGSVDLSTIDVDGESTLDALKAPTWQELLDEWPESDVFEETKLESFLDWHRLSALPDGPAHKVIDWVVAGGESGAGARPMHPDWARQLRDQCAAVGVPFLFKQWGDWTPGVNACGSVNRTVETAEWYNDAWHFAKVTPRVSQEMHADYEPDLFRVGKRAAGRLLDGLLHDAFPEARHD